MSKKPGTLIVPPHSEFNRRHIGPLWFLVFLLPVVVTFNPVHQAQARGVPAQEGILNFGKVSEHLYRGAQPDATGIKSLKKLGIKLIVNLRMAGECWKDEAVEAAANGILYTNFPMSGTSRPNDQQVKQILSLFENCGDAIFVHCQHGCDRTGTIVACYRIQHDGWSNDLALLEAKHYGISRWEFLMQRFVRNFGHSNKPEMLQARAN